MSDRTAVLADFALAKAVTDWPTHAEWSYRCYYTSTPRLRLSGSHSSAGALWAGQSRDGLGNTCQLSRKTDTGLDLGSS
ncbi:hypothetical protein CLOP_g15349 [Closterium sp. NIES-67]|nr:hypothetical protein CLOP_g15349 [Closterium sp. NIES-67]